MTNLEASEIIKTKMALHAKMFGHFVEEPLRTAYMMAILALEKADKDAIPTEWIIKQIQEQSLGESKAYSKLLKLWESEKEQ